MIKEINCDRLVLCVLLTLARFSADCALVKHVNAVIIPSELWGSYRISVKFGKNKLKFTTPAA